MECGSTQRKLIWDSAIKLSSLAGWCPQSSRLMWINGCRLRTCPCAACCMHAVWTNENWWRSQKHDSKSELKTRWVSAGRYKAGKWGFSHANRHHFARECPPTALCTRGAFPCKRSQRSLKRIILATRNMYSKPNSAGAHVLLTLKVVLLSLRS